MALLPRTILAVRMTNPEADCHPAGRAGANHPNVVTVYTRSASGAGATHVEGSILTSYAASQKRLHGPFAVVPPRFKGILTRVEHLPVLVAASPHSSYDISLHVRSATMPDVMAGGMANCPKAVVNQTASGKEWEPTAVVSVTDDIIVKIRNLGSSATYRPKAAFRMFFE